MGQGVTQFWTHLSLEKEVQEGKGLVDACKAAGVKLFVWSGLEDVTKVSKGKYTHVLHFDGKVRLPRPASLVAS